MKRTGAAFLACVAAILASGADPAGWAADGTIRKIPLVELEIRPLTAPSAQPPERLELKADRPGSVDFDAVWEDVGEVRVELEARAEAAGAARGLRFRATLTLPDGSRVQTARDSTVDERGTILFELYRREGRPFTLAITATVSETWEVAQAPSLGEAVRFDVEVMRVEGSSRTSLERNMLQTFESQTVRYEFKLGPAATDDALTLRLTPVRIVGELLETRVNVEGRVNAGGETTVIGREETLIVSRDQTTPLDVVAGDPAEGYRFELTPRF